MRRMGSVTAVALALGFTGAGTASAATFVVDNDRAQCPSAAYRTIQSAIDAAGADDTVSVCAGGYRERVFIPRDKPGLVLEAQRRRTVTIVAPANFPAAEGGAFSRLRVVVVAAGRRSVVRGFRITGPLPRNPLCGQLGFTHHAGVQIGASLVRIEDNHIRDIRDNCGEGDGIWAGDAQNELGQGFSADDAVIRGNLIEQYRKTGVIVETAFPDQPVRIVDNEIIGAQSRPQTIGVLVAQEGAVDVEDNFIHSNRGRGISVAGAESSGNVLRGNRLRGNGIGIEDSDGFGGTVIADNVIEASRTDGIVSLNSLTFAPATITGNIVRDSGRHGLSIGAAGVVSRNQSLRSRGDGIRVEFGEDIRLDRNVASGSRGLDCRDLTGPGGPGTLGTLNFWTANTGRTSSPAGLCNP